MTDNRTTELLREGLTKRGIEWRSGLEGVTFVGDWCFVEYDNGRLAATCEPVLTHEQAIAATLGKPMKKDLRQALDFMRIWISDDAHLGESELSYEFEKAEGLRKLEAIEQAIAATLGRPKVKKVRGMTYDEHGGEVYFLACSGCGDWVDGDLDCIGEYDGPNFCHNCGGEFDGPLTCKVCGELADMEFGDMCAECYWYEGEGNDER